MKKIIMLLVFLYASVSFADSLQIFNSIQLEPNRIHFIDNYVGYICGGGGISISYDFGEHWYHHYGSVNSADTTQAIYDFQFLPDSTAYAVGWRGTPINDTVWEFNNLVIKSTNQGINWFDIMSVPIGKFTPQEWEQRIKEIKYPKKKSSSSGTNLLFSVYCFNSQQIVASGNMAKIYTTSNGGTTWQEGITGWNAISRFTYHNGLLYGLENNQIGLSTNYGASWSLMPQPPGCFAESLIFPANKIFAGGTNGYFLSTSYTINNGNNWITSILNDSGSFTDMLFLDDNNGYATAHNPIMWGVWNLPKGYILKTSDGGNNWSKIFEQDWAEMMGMCQFEQYLFFVGMGRVARLELKTLSVHNNQNGLPREFKLRQNYPNPFNPGTTINYSVPKKSSVKITVYDIMGKEMKTLVNETKNSGSYEVQFDGTNLSSGIYFYKISAGNYTETKKMILVK